MIDALNTGECPPDRVLVGYIEFGRRGGGPQLRLSSFQPAQRPAHEYDAAATIDDHAGGGEANAGGSAGDDDCTAAESVKVVCDPLRHIPSAPRLNESALPFQARPAFDILSAASPLGTAAARPFAERFVSAGSCSLYKRIRLSRRGFCSCPLAGPVAITQHLVAGMDREFDEHRPLGNSEHFGTDVDDAPAEFETEVGRAATPNLHEHHRD